MRKLICFATCLVLFLPSVFGTEYEQSEYYSSSYARLSYVNGDVYVQRGQDLGYDEAVVNLPIVEGDQLGTREGRTEVQLGSGNYVRIDRDTQIDFTTLPKRGNDLISFNLLNGNIYLRVGSLEFEKGIEIHTPDASFYVLDAGLYRLEVVANQETRLYVIEGEIEAAGEEGSVAVQRGENLIAENGLFRSSDSRSLGYAENFAEWNRTRDGFYNRRVSRRYLPSELYDFETELDYYGRWVYETSYGYVWVPHVVHSTWRPYHHGRWVWYPIIGWTWVSYNPWGWCVSHYGRWHWRLGLGWYWIPRRAWSPAWVYWYSGYNHIGWCPLSYYGHPVVIINNHFYGRYYHQNYPAHSRALTVIQKNQLQSRHISKVALSQNSVSRVGKIALSNQQPAVRYRADRTSITALRARGTFERTKSQQVSKRYVSGNSGAVLERSNPVMRSGNVRSIDGKSRSVSKDVTMKSQTDARDISRVDRSNMPVRSGSSISIDKGTISRIKKYSSRSRSDSSSSSSPRGSVIPVKIDPRAARPMDQKYQSRSSSSRDSSSQSGITRIKKYSSRSRSDSSSSSSPRGSVIPVKIDPRTARPMDQKYQSRGSSSRDSSSQSGVSRVQKYSGSDLNRSSSANKTQKYSSSRSTSPVKRFTSRISVPSSSYRDNKSTAQSTNRSYTSRSSISRTPSRSPSTSRSRISSSSRSSSSRNVSSSSRARSSSPSSTSRSTIRSSSSRSRSSAVSRSSRSSRSSSSGRSRSKRR